MSAPKYWLTLVIVWVSVTLFAQQSGIQYQAVVRDSNGTTLQNTQVSFQFSIAQDTSSSSIFYTEQHVNVQTNEFGIINLVIGDGSATFGNFNSVDWSTPPHFIQIGLDVSGATSFTNMGGFGFYTVPYAFHSATADSSLNDFDRDPNNELQTIILSGDSIKLSDGGGVDLVHLNDTTAIKNLQLELNSRFDNLSIKLSADSLGIANQIALLNQKSSADSAIFDASLVKLNLRIDTANQALLDEMLNQDTINDSLSVALQNVDQSDTNELNSGFTVNGGNLELTDGGGTLSVPINQLGTDQQTIILTNDSLSITNGDTVDLSQFRDTAAINDLSKALLDSTANTKSQQQAANSQLLSKINTDSLAQASELADSTSQLRTEQLTALSDTARAIRADLDDSLSTLNAQLSTNLTDSSANIKSQLADTASTLRGLINNVSAASGNGLVDTAQDIRTALKDTTTILKSQQQVANSQLLSKINTDSTAQASELADSTSQLRTEQLSALSDTASAIRADLDDSLSTLNTQLSTNLTDSASNIKSQLADTASQLRTEQQTANSQQLTALQDSTTNTRAQLADTASTLRGLINNVSAASGNGLVDTAQDIRTALRDTTTILKSQQQAANSQLLSKINTDSTAQASELADSTSQLRSEQQTANSQQLTALQDSTTNTRAQLADTASTLRGLISGVSAASGNGLVDTAQALRTALKDSTTVLKSQQQVANSQLLSKINTDSTAQASELADSTSQLRTEQLTALQDSTTNTRAQLTDTSSTLRALINNVSAASGNGLVDTAQDLRTALRDTTTVLKSQQQTANSQLLSKINTDSLAQASELADSTSQLRTEQLTANSQQLTALQDSTTNIRSQITDTASTLRALINSANSDNQNLTFSGDSILIDNGNGTDLSNLRDSAILISGNTIVDSTNATRAIILANNTVGSTALNDTAAAIRSSLADSASTLRSLISISGSDDQNLTLTNKQLSIESGNSVDLRTLSDSSIAALTDTANNIRASIAALSFPTDTLDRIVRNDSNYVIAGNNSATISVGTGSFGFSKGRISPSTGSTFYIGNGAGNSDTLISDRNNIGIGERALFNFNNGGENTVFGDEAFRDLVSGSNNTAIGRWAGIGVNSGNNNVFLGTNSGQTGSENTLLGAATSASSGSGNVKIGFLAGASKNGDNMLFIDNSNTSSPLIRGTFAGDSLTINGTFQTVGTDSITYPTTDGTSGQVLTTDGSGVLAFEDAAVSNDTSRIADASNKSYVEVGSFGVTIVQRDTLFHSFERGALSFSNTGFSVFIGNGAGFSDDLNDNENVFIGDESGTENINGRSNTFVGFESGTSNTTGTGNTFLGNQSGEDHTTGLLNTFVGDGSGGQVTTGSENTLIGVGAGDQIITGEYNTILGSNDGLGVSNSTATGNVFIGYNTGRNHIGDSLLLIDNSDTLFPLIYGDLSNDSLKIFGSLSVGNEYTFPITDGANNQVLTTDGSGNLTFQTPAAGSDDQNLTLTKGQLSIESGNSVDLRVISDSAITALGDSATNIRNALTDSSTALRTAISNANDNLGDHTATQNIQLDGNYLSNDGGNEGLQIDNSGRAAFRGNPQSDTRLFIDETTVATGISVIQEDASVARVAIKGEVTGANGTQAYAIEGEATSGATNNYGVHAIATGSGGTNYGVFGKAINGTSNYAGYFDDGSVYIKQDLKVDSYGILDSLNINGAFGFPTTDGTNGQVLTTDGSGNVTFETPVAGSDDQTLTFSKNQLSIEAGNSVDLRVLSDSTIQANVDSSSALRSALQIAKGQQQVILADSFANIKSQLADTASTLRSLISTSGSDDQTIDLTNKQLSIEGGNSVDLRTLSDSSIAALGDTATAIRTALTDSSSALRTAISNAGDNLGNHTATSNINLNGNSLTGTGGANLTLTETVGFKLTKTGNFLANDTTIVVATFEQQSDDLGPQRGGHLSFVARDGNNGGLEAGRISWTTLSVEDEGHLGFWTGYGSDMKRAMTIDHFQNVGIGTYYPDARLDVLGKATVDTLNINSQYTFPSEDGSANEILQTDGAGNVTWETIASTTPTLLSDADNNTKIQVEESTNEDIIRFDMGGTEYFRMNKARLEPENSGFSVFVGEEAGLNDDYSNNHNAFVGYRSGRSNTTGNQNTALGSNSLFSSTTGGNNTTIGYSAGWSIRGNNNTAVGSSALAQDTSGSGNTALGVGAMGIHKNGSGNVAIGGLSLNRNEVGAGNIAIGQQAGYDELGSNKLYIENSNSSTPLIWGDFANDSVKIYGSLSIGDEFTFPTTDGTSGQVLQTDGSGDLQWSSIAANNDNSSTNELVTSFQITATNLELEDAGNTFSVDLSPYDQASELTVVQDSLRLLWTAAGGDNDQSASNELVTSFQITSTDLQLEDAGNTFTIPLSSFGDNLGDHTATSNLDLGTNTLVGDGGSSGIKINSDGRISMGGGPPQTNRRLYVNTFNDQYAGQFNNSVSGATNTSFGIEGRSTGANPSGSNIGIKGEASGAGTNVAVQGIGAGSGSYSGFFMQGKFYIADSLGVGTSNPTARLDISGTATVDTLNINSAFNLPSTDGTNGQVLQTDGSGNATWGSVAGSPWSSNIDSISANNKFIGIGTSNPIARLHLEDTVGFGNTIGIYNKVKDTLSTGDIYGYKASLSGKKADKLFGINIDLTASENFFTKNYGVKAAVTANSSGTSSDYFGGHFVATGTETSAEYAGVYAEATGADANYAVWSKASGGNENYAGYFEQGDVLINDKLYVGGTFGNNTHMKTNLKGGLKTDSLRVTDGAVNGYVLTSDANGDASWAAPSGDNLGNHTATTNIKLDGKYLSGDGDSEGIYIDGSGNTMIGTTTPAGLFTVSDGSGNYTGVFNNTASTSVTRALSGSATGNSGGNVGVFGEASNGSGSNYGVQGEASSTASGTNYAFYANAENSGAKNYALYANKGDVEVNDTLRIKTNTAIAGSVLKGSSSGGAYWAVDTLTCPTGFTYVKGTFCIETAERTATTWFAADSVCTINGYKLADYSDWYGATSIKTLTDETDDWEWVSNISQNNMMVVGNGGRRNRTFLDPETETAPYRCTYRKP